MSKTDKTKPYHIRLREVGAHENPRYSHKNRPAYIVPGDFKWSYAERGVGPTHVKWAKRYRSKKNRRRDVPLTQMRGHGWGEENMNKWN